MGCVGIAQSSLIDVCELYVHLQGYAKYLKAGILVGTFLMMEQARNASVLATGSRCSCVMIARGTTQTEIFEDAHC